MLGDLGSSGGSVSYDYPLTAERRAVAKMTVYPTLLHQVKMRMRGGWLLFVQQMQLTRKRAQFERTKAELGGLDQAALTGY